MKCIISVFLFALLCLEVSSTGFAQSNQVPFGARPSGLGDAFVAVADDGNALYWNPAGISTLNHHELNSMLSNTFNIGLQHGFLGYVFPLTDRHAVGFSWFNEGFSDDEINYGWNVYQLSYGRQFLKNLSLGGSVKFGQYSFVLDGTTLGNPSGFSADLGALYTYRKLKIGLLWQDIGDFTIKHDSGNKEAVREQALRLGASYSPMDNLLLASSVTINDRLNLGAEYWGFGNIVALRAGLQHDIYDTSFPETIYSFGGSLKYNIFQFDYSYTIYPILSNTHRFSVSLAFSFSRSKVKISKVKIAEVYASRFKDYGNKIFGAIVLENQEKENVDAQVTFFVEKLMEKPEIIYEGGLRTDVPQPAPIRSTFSEDKIFGLSQDIVAQASIDISYVTSKGDQYRKKDQKTEKFYVYALGAVSWKEGPEAAVSFITPDDPLIENFAKNALKPYQDILKKYEEKRNLLKAAILFDALGNIGLRYEPDRYTPFSTVSGAGGATDNIRYPRQMLNQKVGYGDCDDLTVLFASLLEAENIETAIALAPGHLYLYFNTGKLKRSADKLLNYPELLFIDQDEKIWLPVETTRIGSSLKEAIIAGAKREKLKFAKVSAARKDYEPAFPPEPTQIVSPPGREEIERLFKTDYEFLITGGSQEKISNLEKLVESNPTDERVLMQLAEAYYEAGKTVQAKQTLQKIIQLNSNSIEARFLLGKIYTEEKQYQAAFNQAETIRNISAIEIQGYLLVALVYYSQQDYQQALNWYEQATQKAPQSDLLREYPIPLWIERKNNN